MTDFRSADEHYAKVDCEFKALPKTGKSVAVLVNGEGKLKYIPLSVIHAGDLYDMDKYVAGDEITLRVMQWFARKELEID